MQIYVCKIVVIIYLNIFYFGSNQIKVQPTIVQAKHFNQETTD